MFVTGNYRRDAGTHYTATTGTYLTAITGILYSATAGTITPLSSGCGFYFITLFLPSQQCGLHVL